jgi:AraC-like DNA-binding protein
MSDLLSHALDDLRPRGAGYFPSRLAAPWGFSVPDGPASYHVILDGDCLLDVDGADPVRLSAGDLAVTPQGASFIFRSGPEALAPPIDEVFDAPDDDGLYRRDGTGEATRLVCGTLTFDDTLPHPLLDALPPLIVVREADQGRVPRLRSLLDLCAAEARAPRPGASALMGHVGCVLLIQAIRAHLSTSETTAAGWLRALDDPPLARALQAVHADPAADWTVERMAQEAGLSRSAFAARFADTVGETPMDYVRTWRMREAARLLRDEEAPLDAVAERVGYASGAALSRAFKRVAGQPPGQYRERAEPPPADPVPA